MEDDLNAGEAAGTTRAEELADPPAVDAHLRMLVHLCNTAGPPTSMSMTLFIGSGVISGTLISYEEWLDRWLRSMEAASKGLAQGVREGREEALAAMAANGEDPEAGGPLPHFAHLRDAKLFTGEQQLAVDLWRGRLSEITGWMSGSYS